MIPGTADLLQFDDRNARSLEINHDAIVIKPSPNTGLAGMSQPA